MEYIDYLESVKRLNLWARAYYIDDNPIASDEEYDRLYHEILKFEKENPDKIASNSPKRGLEERLERSLKRLLTLSLCGVWRIFSAVES